MPLRTQPNTAVRRTSIAGKGPAAALLAVITLSSPALSQQSSLLHRGSPSGQMPLVGPSAQSGSPQPGWWPSEPALALSQASRIYVPPAPVRTFAINDIVTIRVDELARMRAEGAAENRKNSLYDAILKDWISLSGGALKPADQADGDPRVAGQLNQLYRADASIESRESLTFNIAASIVDIRPNGNLVLEAHKTIWVNENAFETALTGTCRAADIGPDNVLLSRDLLDPQIRKMERGRLRDGYRRGWFQRWWEEFQLF